MLRFLLISVLVLSVSGQRLRVKKPKVQQELVNRQDGPAPPPVAPVNAATNVTLDVYYESLCPDSRNFIVKQLQPSWRKINSFVTLRLVPFGKASWVANNFGGYDFQCQHGRAECEGNKIHACGIEYSSDIAQALSFVTCMMKQPNDIEPCATESGIDIAVLSNCWSSGQSEQLLQANGVETLSLQPRLTFVPWLIFNGTWTDTNQWDGLADLVNIACANAPAAPACATPSSPANPPAPAPAPAPSS